MKKTLLALAVMTAAGAVSANTIVETDKASVGINGTLKGQLISNPVTKAADEAGEERTYGIDVGDASIAVNAEAMIWENFTAFGSYGLTMEEGDVSSDDVFIGFKGTWGTFRAGQTGHAWNAGNSASKEFGGVDFSDDEFVDGDDILRYDYAADMFAVGVSYSLDSDPSKDFDNNRLAVSGTLDLDVVSLGADYTTGKTNGDNVLGAATDFTSYGVEATGSIAAFTIGAGYTFLEVGEGSVKPSVDTIDYFVTYAVSDRLSFALGGQTLSTDDAGGFKGQAIYANADYKLTDIVDTWVEIGNYSSEDDDSSELWEDGLGFVIGMSIGF